MISSQARYDHFDTLPYSNCVRRMGNFPAAHIILPGFGGKVKRFLSKRLTTAGING